MSSRGPGRGSNTSSPFGPYTLLRKIATGGTAEIFLARRHGVEGFARHLAIKRILPHLEAEAGFVKLLMDEARLAAHLHHGHIIPIYEVGVEAGLAYIAMEYLPGTDLGRLHRTARRHRRRVLVATRDVAWREAISNAIGKRVDVEIVTALDASQCRERSAEGHLDLALIDTQLVAPQRDPLLRELQSDHPELLRTLLLGPTPGRHHGCHAVGLEDRSPASLADVAQRCLSARVPIELSIQIVRAVAEALDYAHTATDFSGRPLHVVHRDVNPSNVLISLGGVVKLVDFGIARAAVRPGEEGRGNLVGTVNYMCPEQACGVEPDLRGDVFSLGVVLHELISGEHPFSADNEFATLRAIRETYQKPLARLIPGIPRGISDLCERSLIKDPGHRMATAADLLTGLEELVRHEGLSLSPKRLAKYLDFVYTPDERTAMGVADAAYTYPPTPAVQVDAARNALDAARNDREVARNALDAARNDREVEVDVDLADLEDFDDHGGHTVG